LARQEVVGRDIFRPIGRAVDDNDLFKRGASERLRPEAFGQRGLAQGDARLGVVQEEVQNVGLGLDIQQHRNETGACGAEERCRVDRRIVQEEGNAVAAFETRGDESIAPARGLGGKLGVGHAAGWADDGELIGIAVEVVP
jgi:hypothetical protein